jgi:hypothetical protein
VSANRHEVEHRELARWKAKRDRDAAESTDLGAGYSARAAAQASYNSFTGPVYANLLADHLRKTHNVEPVDPWPLDFELEAQHDKLHEAAMPPCEKVELVEPQDLDAALETSLRNLCDDVMSGEVWPE